MSSRPWSVCRRLCDCGCCRDAQARYADLQGTCPRTSPSITQGPAAADAGVRSNLGDSDGQILGRSRRRSILWGGMSSPLLVLLTCFGLAVAGALLVGEPH